MSKYIFTKANLVEEICQKSHLGKSNSKPQFNFPGVNIDYCFKV